VDGSGEGSGGKEYFKVREIKSLYFFSISGKEKKNFTVFLPHFRHSDLLVLEWITITIFCTLINNTKSKKFLKFSYFGI